MIRVYYDLVRYTFFLLAMMVGFCIGAVLFQPARGETTDDWPERPQWVTDRAHALTADQSLDLQQRLQRLQRDTTAQAVVVIVAGLPDDAPDLAMLGDRLTHRWRLGTTADNNGAIIMLDVTGHHDRIEVGSGLESALPDAVAYDLWHHQRDALRRGDAYAAVSAVVDGVIARVRAAPRTDPRVKPEPSWTSGIGTIIATAMALGASAFTFIAIFSTRREQQRRERDEMERQARLMREAERTRPVFTTRSSSDEQTRPVFTTTTPPISTRPGPFVAHPLSDPMPRPMPHGAQNPRPVPRADQESTSRDRDTNRPFRAPTGTSDDGLGSAVVGGLIGGMLSGSRRDSNTGSSNDASGSVNSPSSDDSGSFDGGGGDFGGGGDSY